jgi:hypothetical protein
VIYTNIGRSSIVDGNADGYMNYKPRDKWLMEASRIEYFLVLSTD